MLSKKNKNLIREFAKANLDFHRQSGNKIRPLLLLNFSICTNQIVITVGECFVV